MRESVNSSEPGHRVDPPDSPDHVDAVLVALQSAVGGAHLSPDDIGGDVRTNPFTSAADMDRLIRWASAPSMERDDSW